MEALWAIGWQKTQVVLLSDGLPQTPPNLSEKNIPVLELPPLSWGKFQVFSPKVGQRYIHWHSPQARAMLPQHVNVRIRAELLRDGVVAKAP